MYVGAWDLLLTFGVWVLCLVVDSRLRRLPFKRYFNKTYWLRTENIRMDERLISGKRDELGQTQKFGDNARGGLAEDLRGPFAFIVLYFWILMIESWVVSSHLTKSHEAYMYWSSLEFQVSFWVWAVLMVPVIMWDRDRGRMPAYAGLFIFCLVIAKLTSALGW